MAFEEITDALHTVQDKTQSYVNSTAEFHKLRFFKTTMKFTTRLVNVLIVGAIALLAVLFVLAGTAMWLNDVMESSYAGFFIAGAFLAIILLGFVFFGKNKVHKIILESFSDVFSDTENRLTTATQTQKKDIL